MPETSLPSFVEWASFPFEGDFRVKKLDDPVAVEPPRMGEDKTECVKCGAPDSDYIWVNENWRVRSMDRPSGLPMVLILESRSHLDLGDLPNMLAAELGVMTVRLERAIRSLDGVARVHVNRWGDAAAHLHLWFMARPQGRLQLRGTFLTMWEEILPAMPEQKWQENLALVAAWLAEFGGQPLAQPPRIEWKAPSSLDQLGAHVDLDLDDAPAADAGQPADPADAGGPHDPDLGGGQVGARSGSALGSGSGVEPADRAGAGAGAGQADRAGAGGQQPPAAGPAAGQYGPAAAADGSAATDATVGDRAPVGSGGPTAFEPR